MKLSSFASFVFLALLSFSFVACASKHATETDQATVEALMLSSEGDFAACYDQYQSRFPEGGEGKIHLRADYLPNGEFANVRSVDSFPGSGPLIHCLSAVVESWIAVPPYSRGPVDLNFDFEKDAVTEAKPLSPEEIESVMSKQSSDFLQCYEKARADFPGIEKGNMRLEFEVLTNGRTGRIRELSGFEGSSLVFTCLRDRARTWQFPERDISTSVIWTWTFG